MATPEWFGKFKHRMAEIVETENDVLERDMVRSQEIEPEKGETEEEMYRRIRLEQEKQEEEESPSGCMNGTAATFPRSPAAYTVRCAC